MGGAGGSSPESESEAEAEAEPEEPAKVKGRIVILHYRVLCSYYVFI